MGEDTRRFTTATYRVAVEKQEEFLALLNGCEETMRDLGLITDRPAARMRSLGDPELVLEIFEWVDEGAFGRAQQSAPVREWWGKYESTWIAGAVPLEDFPEGSERWARFEPFE